MMDERTRTTDEQTAPKLRRKLPTAPVVKSKPRRGKLIVGLIVLIGLAAGGYWAYRSQYATQPASTAQRTVPQGAPQSVGAATVGQGDIRVIVNGLGTVTPIATVTVQTQINGQLLEVGFTEGQLVKKGDFLAQIDPRPYQLLQAQYEGQLAHDQGLLAQSQVDLVALSEIGGAEFDRAPAIRGSSLHRAAEPGHGETRPGADRSAEAQRHLLPHRVAGHRPDRAAPGRSGKLHPDNRHYWHRGGNANAADHGDLPDPRRRSARHPAAAQCRHAARSIRL